VGVCSYCNLQNSEENPFICPSPSVPPTDRRPDAHICGPPGPQAPQLPRSTGGPEEGWAGQRPPSAQVCTWGPSYCSWLGSTMTSAQAWMDLFTSGSLSFSVSHAGPHLLLPVMCVCIKHPHRAKVLETRNPGKDQMQQRRMAACTMTLRVQTVHAEVKPKAGPVRAPGPGHAGDTGLRACRAGGHRSARRLLPLAARARTASQRSGGHCAGRW
jgi:hypothetical protein